MFGVFLPKGGGCRCVQYMTQEQTQKLFTSWLHIWTVYRQVALFRWDSHASGAHLAKVHSWPRRLAASVRLGESLHPKSISTHHLVCHTHGCNHCHLDLQHPFTLILQFDSKHQRYKTRPICRFLKPCSKEGHIRSSISNKNFKSLLCSTRN